MRQFIKSFVLLLSIGLMLTACNEQDMGDIAPVEAHEQLGNYLSVPSADSTAYTYKVSLSANAQKDTLCTISLKTAKGYYAYFAGAKCSYDAASGVMTATFAKENTPYGYPAVVYIKRAHTKDYMIVQLFLLIPTKNGYARQPLHIFNAKETQSFDLTNCIFSGDKGLSLAFYSDGKTASAVLNDADLGQGEFSWDEASHTGTVKLSSGQTFSLSVNAGNQLVATSADGTAYALDCAGTLE